jgi:hypothetical protein
LHSLFYLIKTFYFKSHCPSSGYSAWLSHHHGFILLVSWHAKWKNSIMWGNSLDQFCHQSLKMKLNEKCQCFLLLHGFSNYLHFSYDAYATLNLKGSIIIITWGPKFIAFSQMTSLCSNDGQGDLYENDLQNFQLSWEEIPLIVPSFFGNQCHEE